MIFSRANFGTLFTSLFIQCCGLVTGVVTARMLGPAARGELATILLWPIIFSNLGLMGCNWALAREVAANPAKEKEWVCAAIAVGLATAALFLILGYVLIPRVLPHDRIYLAPLTRFCLLLIPLDILNQTLLAIEQGRMRWKRYNILRASFFVFYVILIYLIWGNGNAPVSWFVWAFLASHLLAALIRLSMQAKSLAAGALHAADCLVLLRRGLPYFWATASNLLSLQLDRILVVSMMSTEAAGIYAVALTFGNAQSSLGEALGTTSFAILSTEKNAGTRQKIIAETFRQSALSSAGLGLLLACLIPLLIRPLFGAAFSQALRPAVILTIAAALGTSSSILNQGLRGVGCPFPGLACQLLGTGVLALAAALLLPRFGLMGMAWAVMLSACTQVVALVAWAATWLRMSPSCFWPFGTKDIRVFCQNVMALRLRYSRSPA